MERITLESGKPIQLTLNLTERSTIFVVHQGSSPIEKPPKKAAEERRVSPSVVLALLADFNRYGRDDMDINRSEKDFIEALKAARKKTKN